MSITLDRLHRLLVAAEIFLQRDRVLRARIMSTCAKIAANRMTLQDGIDEIYTDLRTTPQYHPAENVITNERATYQHTYKRSIYERERKQRRRAGIPPNLAGQPITPRGSVHEFPTSPSFTERQPSPEEQLILENMNADDTDINNWVTEDPPQSLPDMEKGLSDQQKREAEAQLEIIRRAREAKS